jgi:hypothetical protein
MKTPWSENIIVYEINKAKKIFKNFNLNCSWNFSVDYHLLKVTVLYEDIT